MRKVKGWLCMVPVQITIEGTTEVLKLPKESLGLFAAYRYKKDARAISGPDAPLMEMEITIHEPDSEG